MYKYCIGRTPITRPGLRPATKTYSLTLPSRNERGRHWNTCDKLITENLIIIR